MTYRHAETSRAPLITLLLWPLVFLTLVGCSPRPVERSVQDFCTEKLNGKRVAFNGFLSYKSITICGEDSWGKARCPLTIESEPGGPSYGQTHLVWIYLGSSENQMHMPTELQLGVDSIKVFGSDGKRLDLKQPVRIVADIRSVEVIGGATECSADAVTLTQIDRK
jgi:hypothetical protein